MKYANTINSSDKTLWSKEYTLKTSELEKSLNSSTFCIDDSITINFEDYRKQAQNFRFIYNVPVESYMELQLNLNYDTDITKTGERKQEKSIISLKIPLLQDVFTIEENYQKLDTQISIESTNIEAKTNKVTIIIGIALMQEYVRAKLINNYKKISTYVIITIIFIIVNINFPQFISSCTNNELTFKYICGTIIPIIVTSALCSYLAKTGGYQLIYAYIVPIKLNYILVPVYPDLDWFLLTIFNLILVIILIFYNNYEHTIKTNRMTRRELRKESSSKFLPIMILLIILVSFIAGILPYKPVAVMSNSMKPAFSRGSIVIVEKVNDKYEKIKVGDVIEFKTEYGTIIHRVVNIEKDANDKLLFITKGDANMTNDAATVSQENVVGITKFYIEYLGYPSVWFSEIVLGRKSVIEL